MTDQSPQKMRCAKTEALVYQLRRARKWAKDVRANSPPGPAHDLAWGLICLTVDHDPDTYSPWLEAPALHPERLIKAVELAHEIARLIQKADELRSMMFLDGGKQP